MLTQWVDAFPHDLIARNNFAGCLGSLGEPDRAFGESREAARLLPSPFTYWMWIGRSFHADRIAEAETALDDARGEASIRRYSAIYRPTLAFFRNDDAALQEVWTWAEGKSEAHLVINGKGDGRGGSGPVSSRPPHAGDRDAMSGGVSYALEMALMRATVGLPTSVDATPRRTGLSGHGS